MGEGGYYIFSNPRKPSAVAAAGRLAELFAARRERVLVDAWMHDLLHTGIRCGIREIPLDISAIISLGGDGTLLRILPAAASIGIPVLGVNMGRVGFLLEADEDELETAVQRLVDRDYRIEERMMLRCRPNGREGMLVMNDVALTRGKNPGSIEVRATADHELIFTSHGDGVLVSTPTGTTGYALSAGGPVVYPTLESMLVVPICSHVVSQRPIVLPAEHTIRLEAAPSAIECQVIMDGQVTLPVTGAVSVEIARAPEKARFIRFKEQRFFTRLRHKQAEWSSEREAEK